MRVAIVHDDLVQWGGAEKVLLAISEVYPEAPIYTSVFDDKNLILKEKFSNEQSSPTSKKIITSFMQKIPFWRDMYKLLLPLYPVAFEQFDFSSFDLVISQTTRFAKSVITKPETLHICYMHTPPRFLWNFSGKKVPKLLNRYFSRLRVYDQVSAKRVDVFLAGSKNTQRRIKKIYDEDSEVLVPFFETDQNFEPFEGDYYLLIARLNSYKRVDIAVEAFNGLGWKLKVVGVGPEFSKLKRKAKKNIEFLGSVSESLLNNLLAGCKGLVITAEEDFGLTSLEAQSFGKAVVAYKLGGVLETVVENENGIFFEEQSAKSLIAALIKFEKSRFNPMDSIKNAQKFSKENFKKKLTFLVDASIEKQFSYNI